MPLSYNMAPGGLHYSPERDTAYNYPRMVSCIIRAFNKELWPQLLDALVTRHYDKDTLWEDVCKAKDCFCQFLETCCQDPTEKLEDVLKRTGFLDLPQPAQIAWCAMLGQVMTGQLFQGLRDITIQGTQHDVIIKLMQAGREAAAIMNGVHDPFDEAHIALAQEMRFNAVITEMRESGMSQQTIRDLLAANFNKEQALV